MTTTVALVKNKDPHCGVRLVLKMINASSLISPEDKVLIKPNYLTDKHPSTGVTTDTRIVSEIIHFVKSRGVKDITVADGGWTNTKKVFDKVGIRTVSEREGVKLVDLNDDTRVRVKIPKAIALKEFYMAKTVMESDSIINVPKLKIHSFAKVTLSIKNLMGAILPKSIIHNKLDEKLVDLASFIKPKFNIVDGIIGCERNEYAGNPIPMDLIIGGRDIVAVDVIGSLIMEQDPNKIGYITLAAKKGIGTANLKDIKVIGEQIEKVKKSFKHMD